MSDITDWIGELTGRGYDLVETAGYTFRHRKGEDHWNSNYPMVHTVLHFKKNNQSIVVNAYACNSVRWTIYAVAFTGKAPNRYKDFELNGTKEKEIPDLQSLRKLLKDNPWNE
jgi:hypothetical protein